MSRRSPSNAGFTLIELMVAVTISAITMAAVFGFFATQDSIMKSQANQGFAGQSLRIANDFIQRDLRAAGFGDQYINAIKIEQSCPDNPRTPAVDACPPIPGTATGTDRVTVFFRVADSRLYGCDPLICKNNKDNDFVMQEPNDICPNGGLKGKRKGMFCGDEVGQPPVDFTKHPFMYCGATWPDPPYKDLDMCDPNGLECDTVKLKSVTCDTQCGELGRRCTDLRIAGVPDGAGGYDYTAAGVDAWLDNNRRQLYAGENYFVTYQLMDVDDPDDGILELVRMTDWANASRLGVNPGDGTLDEPTVLVSYIDDFQIEVNSTTDASDFRTYDCNSDPSAADGCSEVWKSKDIYLSDENIGGGNSSWESAGGTMDVAWGGKAHTTTWPNIRTSCQAETGGIEGTCAAANSCWGCARRVRAVRFSFVARGTDPIYDVRGASEGVELDCTQAINANNPHCITTHRVTVNINGTSTTYNDGVPRKVLSSVVALRNVLGGNQ